MAIISNGTTIASGGSLSVSANPPTSSNTVGTYVIAKRAGTSGTIGYGDTEAGSGYNAGNVSGYVNGSSLSGTWRIMGNMGAGDSPRSYTTLLVRIS